MEYACQKGRPELQSVSNEPIVCPNPKKPFLVRATEGNAVDFRLPGVPTKTLEAFDFAAAGTSKAGKSAAASTSPSATSSA